MNFLPLSLKRIQMFKRISEKETVYLRQCEMWIKEAAMTKPLNIMLCDNEGFLRN